MRKRSTSPGRVATGQGCGRGQGLRRAGRPNGSPPHGLPRRKPIQGQGFHNPENGSARKGSGEQKSWPAPPCTPVPCPHWRGTDWCQLRADSLRGARRPHLLSDGPCRPPLTRLSPPASILPTPALRAESTRQLSPLWGVGSLLLLLPHPERPPECWGANAPHSTVSCRGPGPEVCRESPFTSQLWSHISPSHCQAQPLDPSSQRWPDPSVP